ncbi:MAG: transglutaminase domain-containing protein [candidate division WOR-3 bacterium]|nr:MAG: transglutaminase domain-containing protein [candidate division WOR-3 bacterium]
MLDYYRQSGIITALGEYSYLLAELPDDIAGLCKVVQGVMLHVFWSEAYGVKLSEDRKKEVNLRKVERILSRIVELDGRPIKAAREPEMRVVGNCRDHSVLLCALLKYKGIPARARCGFGTYFVPGKYMDHWICEYWSDRERRWVQVDAQLDSLQVVTLKIDFDPSDLPPRKFLSGGQAWQLCRSGEIDPDLFGIFDMKGLWFVQGDLVRDFMALNNLEVLPWDCNALMTGPDVEVTPEDYELLDKMAELITNGDQAFTEIRSTYESDERLRMPADWSP